MSHSDERLHALVTSLPVLVWETRADGTIVMSEGGGLAGLGFKPKELVGRTVQEVYGHNPQVMAHIERGMAGEAFQTHTEVSGRVMEGRIEPKRDADGKVVGLCGFSLDVTERTRMEQTLRGLSRRLWALLEGERERIARELHDEAGQTLTALKLQLDLARGEKELPAIRDRLEKAAGLAAAVLDELRRVARDLKPGGVAELGLGPALQALATRFGESSGMEVRLDAPRSVAGLDADMETAVYRFVQECLTNIARHAQAKSASVSLKEESRRLLAVVEDDGVGFAPEQVLTGPSLGLAGMLERARILGGSVTIDSRPGGGSRIRLDLPLSEAASVRP